MRKPFEMRWDSFLEPTVQVVSQAELQQLLQLRLFKGQCNWLRNSIRDKLRGDHMVEPGPLDVAMVCREHHNITVEQLTAILGQSRMRELREQMPVTRNYTLELLDSATGKPARKNALSLLEGTLTLNN